MEDLDVVIVGAGFAGLYALHKLRGQGLACRVLEAGGGIGGTWYWNRYPGARCDVESLLYSYSFDAALQQDWTWHERYAAQPEILGYIEHVAERFDLRRDIRLATRVTAAHWDEGAGRWRIEAERGAPVAARFCVVATGCASTPLRPDIPGLERFAGPVLTTGLWPKAPVDFPGLRVGVIGTGSSAIQAIPVIARQAARLTVFQRTPNFSVPARNAPLDPETVQRWKANYPRLRAKARRSRTGLVTQEPRRPAAELSEEAQAAALEARWAEGGLALWEVFADLLTSARANARAAAFARAKIRAAVADPVVAETLCPKGYPFGAKRLCVDTGYYETFNRDNVELVDIRAAPIEAATPEGLTSGGRGHRLDALVLATGFDAMTGALRAIDIRGRAGLGLAEAWAAGPRSYLGIAVAGFPNLFAVTGPGSPSVLSNMIVSIEQHVDWIADCLAHLRSGGMSRIEATAKAQDGWVDHVAALADQTLFPEADSWYLGANVPGKPRVFMPYLGGVGDYRKLCAGIAKRGYQGFRLSA